ncbi:MAG: HAD family hydrolase, partial [Candidatus Parvarchaeum acidophilus ARMAN-5]
GAQKIIFIGWRRYLYLWDKAYNGSNLFIKKLKELEKNCVGLSNNDSQSKENRLKLLSKELGIKFEENQLLLPNDIIEDFMLKKHIKRFDGLISEDLKKELSKKGFIADIKRPEIIIIGFDVDLNYKKLIRVITHINNGVKFILTHSDPLCPYKNKQEIPDAGLMVNMVSEGYNTPLKNNIGENTKLGRSCEVSWSFVSAVTKSPNPKNPNIPNISIKAVRSIFPLKLI